MSSRAYEAFGLPSQIDYLNFRLDILGALLNSVTTPLFESEFGLTARDLRVLRFIKARPGLTLGQLIELTFLEKSVVSKLVTRLVKKGLIQRRIGVDDARNINLHITPATIELLSRANRFSRKWQRQFLSVLKQGEIRMLLELLERLAIHAREQLSTTSGSVGGRRRAPID